MEPNVLLVLCLSFLGWLTVGQASAALNVIEVRKNLTDLPSRKIAERRSSSLPNSS